MMEEVIEINDDDLNSSMERAMRYHRMHYNSRTFWSVIYNSSNVIMIILSTIVTIEGISKILPEHFLIGFGAALGVITSVMSFLNPGSKYQGHLESSKRYIDIYYQLESCHDHNIYKNLVNELNSVDKGAPDVWACFYKKETNDGTA